MDREKMESSFKKTLVKINTELDSYNLRELLELSNSYHKHFMINANKNLEKINTDVNLNESQKDEFIDFLSEDVHIADIIRSKGEELAVIGLYHSIEIAIKKAAKVSGKFSSGKISELHITEKLVKHFNGLDIDIILLNGFNEFNELKLLNNCLKHSGEVSDKLYDANPEIWIKKTKITDSASHFNRLLEPSIKFLGELGNRLISKI